MTAPADDGQIRAYLACLDLVNRFNLLVDTAHATSVMELVTPDFTTSVPGRGDMSMEGFRAALVKREQGPEWRTCHTLANFVFHETDGQVAHASSTLIVHMLSAGAAPSILISRDTFTADGDGRWRFSCRQGEPLPWG